MPFSENNLERENLRVALQPDGLLHLVTGRDWLRSFCGLRLTRHERRYKPIYRYGSDPEDCRQCARILDQRAKFPESPNEELKPVLERIGKLFALSESPNENEAAAALTRANELLQKYNLTRGLVRDSTQQIAEKRMTDSLGANVAEHKYTLANASAQLHDVEWYMHSRWRTAPNWWDGERRARDKHIVFVGLRANVATALVTYPYLLATADAFYRAVRRESGESNVRDYKQGFADRIASRVREHKRAAWDHPEAAALIRLGNEVALNAMRIEGLFFGNGFRIVAGVRNQEAYQRGYGDGARVDIYGAHTSRMLDEG